LARCSGDAESNLGCGRDDIVRAVVISFKCEPNFKYIPKTVRTGGMKVWAKIVALLAGIGVISAAVLILPVREQPEVPSPEFHYWGEGPKGAFASFYKTENISVEPSAPRYTLPLDVTDVSNFDHVIFHLKLSENQTNLLSKNGFVVIPHGQENDMVDVYDYLKSVDIPVFITSDTLLHLYHIQFNEILKIIEENEFFDEIKSVSLAMLNDSIGLYGSLNGDAKEAARRNAAYFAVGLRLLDPGANVPEFVKSEVEQELQLIGEHSGFANSPIFGYEEDYSQYVPRGHYTRSEVLERYFKALMWYGRMAFLLKGGQNPPFDALVSEENAGIHTVQASLIASSMGRVKANSSSVDNLWNRVYGVTAFFVGPADDLTPYEYENAILEVFGENFDPRELTDESKLLELKATLASMRLPEIYGGTGEICIQPPITPEKLDEVLEASQGMHFMGQRYVPDSYVFQNLVFPKVVSFTGEGTPFTLVVTGTGRLTRGFPRGLDVMAVLGSDRALEILENGGDTAYENYAEQLDNLRAKFRGFDENSWNRNLYWSWLYTLKALLEGPDEGYPAFMQTRAWQDKELNTALASWAELRHDTILYAKQSYTPVETSLPQQPPGYAEPVPEFYARVLALTRMTRTGLTGMGVLDHVSIGRLQSLEDILSRLVDISKRELEGVELTEDDYGFIRNFGEQLAPTVEGVESEGMETTVVADVHTDQNTGQVLEEGIGYVNLIVVAYRVPDGSIVIGAGPTFSYHEFKQPMSDRLTDEGWVELLKSNPPARPSWVESFFVES